MKTAISNPEVRINYAWLLQMDVSTRLNRMDKYDLPDYDDPKYPKWTDEYRQEWEAVEQKVLTAMQKFTDLRFYLPVIDVHMATNIIPKSVPLIVGFDGGPKGFVDTLVHELCHVLLTDNNIISLRGKQRDFKIGSEWKKLFGEEHSFTTIAHIPVHAIHKKIFLEVMDGEEGIKSEMDHLKKLKAVDYIKSWDYVNRHGHDKIIDQLKEFYSKLELSNGEKE